MAEARQILRRRKAIRNIHKLCYTMQLIATARFKRAMDRALEAAAYTDKIAELAADLGRAATTVDHPLIRVREPNRIALLVITANRGLCGGYNSNILRTASQHLGRLAGRTVFLDVAGKRGIAYFRFRRIAMRRTYTHFEDRVRYEEVRVLADEFIDAYAKEEIDRVDVAYMKFLSAGRQIPVVETLLPLTAPTGDGDSCGEEIPYEFYPSPEDLLAEILTMAFRTRLFKCFLDAASSEQIARMVAMKGATENAARMDRQLTLLYSRARQEKITKELAEIVGGAEALK